MFRRQDFKKLDLLGSGKKHTKIYKAEHIPTGHIYALKEIEAKTLEKLNEYKEEAVQLAKVQNIPNVVQFYGYFFCETTYNTFRLCIVTEYMSHTQNLELLYRGKKKSGQRWSEKDIAAFMFSLIATCSILQQRGICHRDIKPANLFMLSSGEVKIIDFGESKDHIFDISDENKPSFTMATIRGTPQYLSPVLWKAHVVDGNNRYAEHNVYKSDVFSAGLVVYQIATLKEVTGFNNKTDAVNGEELIHAGLSEVEKTYGHNLASILALMLIFEESQRPSFLELEYFFLEFENNAQDASTTRDSATPIKSNKQQNGTTSIDAKQIKCSELIKLYNRQYNTLVKKDEYKNRSIESSGKKQSHLSATQGSLTFSGRNSIVKSDGEREKNFHSGNQNRSNPDIKMFSPGAFLNAKGDNYEPKIYWFEFGGKSIGRFDFRDNRWRIIGESEEIFPMHFSSVFVESQNAFYLIGGRQESNVKSFCIETMKITNKPSMKSIRNFFASVHHSDKIYIFGGYNDNDKCQIKACECFDTTTQKWKDIGNLSIGRSQAAACLVGDDKIFIVGGYNKSSGLIKSIEEFSLTDHTFKVFDLEIPEGLRRLSVGVFREELLIFGGIKKNFEANDTVYRISLNEKFIEECGNLDKGGVVEGEVIADSEDICHIFTEESNGTLPPFHIRYFSGKKQS